MTLVPRSQCFTTHFVTPFVTIQKPIGPASKALDLALTSPFVPSSGRP